MRPHSQYFLHTAQPLLGLPVSSIGAYRRCAGKPVIQWFGTLLLCLCFGLMGCSKPAPEQALRNSIQQLEQAAIEKDGGAFFSFFAEDFSGPEGLDRDNFRRYIQLIWLQHKDIGVTLGPLDVKLLDDRATVNFTVALSGGQRLIPDHGQIYQVQTGWRLEGDDWKLIAATWKPML